MKYVCMIYYDEATLDALPPSEYDALVREALAYDEELRLRGCLVAGQALERSSASAVVRPRGGSFVTTDGPFVESKEQLGGFLLIEARDLNEAIQLAARIPPARLGCVELRPVREPVGGRSG